MKFRDFLKKYQLILVMSAIVVILIAIKLTYNNQTITSTTIKTVSLTPTPTVIQELLTPTIQGLLTPIPTTTTNQELDISPDYPLQAQLPYSTKDFIIEDYYAPLILKVKVLIPSIDQAEKEVKQWIVESGMAADSHHFVWVK